MAGSEISTNFTVNKVGVDVVNYIPTGGFWNDYGNIIIGILIIIGIIYFTLKKKKKSRKRKEISKKKK